jgi:hypothetical protein
METRLTDGTLAISLATVEVLRATEVCIESRVLRIVFG